MTRIKVEPFMMRMGIRVGKAAVEFTDGPLAGFHLVGFTICEDDRGYTVQFPAAMPDKREVGKKPYFFLRPEDPTLLDRLEDEIIELYKNQIGIINKPRVVEEVKQP